MSYRIDRCPQGRWELAQMRPQSDLAADVVRYAGYLEHGWSIDQRELAAPIVPLIINFGDPFRVRMGRGGPEDHQSFVAGLYDGYADVASIGRAHCMQVDFTPLGAHRFFAMPMRELEGRTVALDQVGRFDDLIERLSHAPGWPTLPCWIGSCAGGWRQPDRIPRRSPGCGANWVSAADGSGWRLWRMRSAGAAST